MDRDPDPDLIAEARDERRRAARARQRAAWNSGPPRDFGDEPWVEDDEPEE